MAEKIKCQNCSKEGNAPFEHICKNGKHVLLIYGDSRPSPPRHTETEMPEEEVVEIMEEAIFHARRFGLQQGLSIFRALRERARIIKRETLPPAEGE